MKKRYRDPPDVGATARDFLGLKYDRDGETDTAGCGKALEDLKEKPESPMPRGGALPAPLAPAVLRQLEYGPETDNAPMPEAIQPRARSILGLGG